MAQRPYRQSRWCGTQVAVAFLVAGLLVSTPVLADRSTDERRLRRACEAGLGSASLLKGHSCELEIERQGASLRLSSARWQKEVVCHLCTDPESQAAARQLGVAIAELVSGQPPATLVLPALGRATSFSVDGVAVEGPQEQILLAPGEHVIEAVTADGRLEARARVDAGQVWTLGFTDTSNNETGVAWRPKDHLSWSVAAMGTGLTLGAVGGFALWQDGQCAGVPAGSAQCGRQHELTGVGIAAIATGALLEMVALWWLWPRRASVTLAMEAKP